MADHLLSTGILAMIILFAGGFGMGYVLGGPETDTRRVLALGTPLRNIPAPLWVATQNFEDPSVAVMVIIASVLLVAMYDLFASWLRDRRNSYTRQGWKTPLDFRARADRA